MLLLAGDAIHGYELHQEMLARGLAVQPATIYRRLRGFEQKRWLRSRWSEPIGGPRRHMYRLTSQGRAALQEMSASIAATREAYSAFAHAHAQTAAQRAGAPGTGETSWHLVTGEDEPGAADAIARPRPPPSPPPVRPRADLLAGWLLLHLAAGATHGYELRRGVGTVHHLTADAGTMYRMLRRFEADEWVRSRWTQSAVAPRRRVYQLTEAGRRNLDRIADRIAMVREGLDGYLLAYERFLGPDASSFAQLSAATRDRS